MAVSRGLWGHLPQLLMLTGMLLAYQKGGHTSFIFACEPSL